jgi:hypothetical protein
MTIAPATILRMPKGRWGGGGGGRWRDKPCVVPYFARRQVAQLSGSGGPSQYLFVTPQLRAILGFAWCWEYGRWGKGHQPLDALDREALLFGNLLKPRCIIAGLKSFAYFVACQVAKPQPPRHYIPVPIYLTELGGAERAGRQDMDQADMAGWLTHCGIPRQPQPAAHIKDWSPPNCSPPGPTSPTRDPQNAPGHHQQVSRRPCHRASTSTHVYIGTHKRVRWSRG